MYKMSHVPQKHNPLLLELDSLCGLHALSTVVAPCLQHRVNEAGIWLSCMWLCEAFIWCNTRLHCGNGQGSQLGVPTGFRNLRDNCKMVPTSTNISKVGCGHKYGTYQCLRPQRKSQQFHACLRDALKFLSGSSSQRHFSNWYFCAGPGVGMCANPLRVGSPLL